MNNPSKSACDRRFDFESLESRIVFSHLAFSSVEEAQFEAAQLSTAYEYNLAPAGVHESFGLAGFGQTVAIIDTGIAYDHYALGGGLGLNYRVVGGWDFAENDANPYDDGPGGFHGTHVAGIVGSDDDTYTGVAPNVDLVALRVFDDHGNGVFDWVEQALQWVHEHRNDFENPITTVNLSLGGEWNADDIPDWAMLEDELAVLHDDGVFVAVAAGNSFRNFITPGLSYPAVSPYVVPVASVGSSGNLSVFSQRNERVLAAPGERITSTATDYLYDFNGVTDDFLSVSGTSMASPYVAGASVLVREAMQLTGGVDINQDDILGVLRRTADSAYDPATGQSYDRINIAAALKAIIPADEYGSTTSGAFRLGTLSGRVQTSGWLNTTDDRDTFYFVAGQSGTVDVALDWRGSPSGAPSLAVASLNSDTRNLRFSVVAGQRYQMSMQGQGVIGPYEIAWNLHPNGPAPGQQAPGGAYSETQYEWVAQETGSMTILATFADLGSGLDIEVYDADGNRLFAKSNPQLEEIIQIAAKQGELYTVKVKGANPDSIVSVWETALIDSTSGAYQTDSDSGNGGINIVHFDDDALFATAGPVEVINRYETVQSAGKHKVQLSVSDELVDASHNAGIDSIDPTPGESRNISLSTLGAAQRSWPANGEGAGEVDIQSVDPLFNPDWVIDQISQWL